LASLSCGLNDLTALNVKNGNNRTFSWFYAVDCPDLYCVDVDDYGWSLVNWTNIDTHTSFSENCHNFTWVPDDYFELALINLGYDDFHDDYVLTNKINTVTSLNVSSYIISDLTGIEDFAALTYLNCATNSLTSLDLRGNTSLTFLYCNGNSLSDLDVSSNTQLTSLLCNGNSLTSLDLSSNAALVQLDCAFNNFSSLNLTHNTLLTELWCYENSLESLDVSNNGALIKLDCSHNSIGNLNLSGNIVLEDLNCSNNTLNSLDVSDNHKMVMLSCLANSLTSLNVKNGNNINFTFFHAENNPDLYCIEVDDADWSRDHWTNIDEHSYFSEDCSPLSISEIADLYSVIVYPNPASEEITISLNSTDMQVNNVKVLDINGKLLLESNKYIINLEHMNPGLYILQIITNKGVINKNIIKE
jgi:hypothetical protein